jgi:hypothetical protein
MNEGRHTLTAVDMATAQLLQGTAESLWDISVTILVTGTAGPQDWEHARAALSHALAALEQPPHEQPHPLGQRSKAPQAVV